MTRQPALWALAWLVTVAAPAVAADEADLRSQASRILNECGVEGGLIVHVGCGDGRLTAALRQRKGLVVHGLDRDPKRVTEARRHVRSLELYGPVSIDLHQGDGLPYADNLARLVVVSGSKAQVPRDEIKRVLCPGGLAVRPVSDTGSPRPEVVLRKPRPAEFDVWTQHLHAADGNPASEDLRVGPPRRVQWMAPPRYFRTHAKDPSLHFMLATEDRVFYNVDEGPYGVIDERLEEKWSLVARDAYSGVLLWKRPLTRWNFRHWERLAEKMRSPTSNWSAPLSLRRRAVADGQRLYATLSYPDALLEELDAATGKTLRTFAGTKGADEIVLHGGILLLRRRSFPGWTDKPMRHLKNLPPETVTALEVKSGEVLWEVESTQLAPLTLAAKGGRVCFRTFDDLVCLELASGRQAWRVPCPAKTAPFDVGSGGALVMWEDVVLAATRDGVKAHALKDGKLLWQDKKLGIGGYGFMSVMSLVVADGLLWHTTAGAGYDPRTGEVARKIEVGELFRTGHHVRCYREKATPRYVIYPRRGLEFVDLSGGDHCRNDWTRGACGFGILPANGLLYVPPNPCHCYSGSLVPGLNAFAPAEARREAAAPAVAEKRLEKGPAYGRVEVADPVVGEDAWPMYRGDPRRRGSTSAALPEDLTLRWTANLGGQLTPPVVAGGRLFVALKDRHEICCLDATAGRVLWSFTVGARVDSSPTVAGSMLLVGCTDGWLYALRAADGALAWRFCAAPHDRRVMIHGQLESAWPVHGSVLVRGGLVYCTAGRSSYLDGGIWVDALDAGTGEVVHRDHLDGPWTDDVEHEGRGHYLQGANSDLFVVDEAGDLNMVHVRWDDTLRRQENPVVVEEELAATTKRPWLKDRDKARLNLSGLRRVPRRVLATNGLLEEPENPRTYWMYGDYWPGFNNAETDAPAAGMTVCVDERNVYAARVFRNPGNQSRYFVVGDGTVVFADPAAGPTDVDFSRTGQPSCFVRGRPPRWSANVSVRAMAMIATKDKLLVAGPPDRLDEEDTLAPFENREGGRLVMLAKKDGRSVAELDLPAPPVFNGQAVAAEKLFVTLTNGEILCLAQPSESP